MYFSFAVLCLIEEYPIRAAGDPKDVVINFSSHSLKENFAARYALPNDEPLGAGKLGFFD